MLGILARSMGLATHLSDEQPHPPSTHELMLREHERRKAAELRQLLEHERRFGR